MARALAASEREKSKARVEASTPIRDAIIGKLNLIIGLIVRMGDNLSIDWTGSDCVPEEKRGLRD